MIFFLFIFFNSVFSGSADRIVKDVNMVLDIGHNINIIDAKPIEIDAYLTDIEKKMKDKAQLNNFLDSWTGRRPDFNKLSMIHCQESFSGVFDYAFSHKDDVKKLRSDFNNIKAILSTYGVSHIPFDQYNDKKKDFWGFGKNDNFKNFQYNTLWWQIDRVTTAIWNVLMQMQIQYEKIIIAQCINNFINALINFQSKYKAMIYAVSALQGVLSSVDQPYDIHFIDDNSAQSIFYLLEEYALEEIKEEVYTTPIQNNKANNKNKIYAETVNLKSYEKKASAYDCPKEFLIKFKGDSYKDSGLAISEKIIKGMCPDNLAKKDRIRLYENKYFFRGF